jgi:glycerophosphoryl diester phosphodiesterase
VSDFTLAELKTLRAVQPFPERPQQFNGRYEIPTFAEVLALVQRESRRYGRSVGIYPETKHPTYHRDLGLPLEGRLVAALRRAGWDRRRAPVFIQSFEQSNLQRLNRMTRVRLIQLVDAYDVDPAGDLVYQAPLDRPYDWTVSGDPELESRTFGFFATNRGLREVATYADGIGPWKRYIVSTKAIALDANGDPADANGDGAVNEADRTTLPPTNLIRRAHRFGLKVHAYTFRNEQSRLAADYEGNPINEYLQFYRLGIDGVFSDFPDTAFTARELFWLE